MKVDTNYTRVIPRDLFNEAKLLKCIGRLCLLIHDNNTPVKMSFEETGEPFNIGMSDCGSLMIVNLEVCIKGEPCVFKTTYNSKSNYPLMLEYDSCEYRVFDEQGEWDSEFMEFCGTMK